MKDRLCWLTQRLADLPGDNSWLSNSENAILATMRFPKRRSDWKLGRFTAKLATRAYHYENKISLSAFEIRSAPDGAPEVFLRGKPSPVSISISHSRNKGLCVVGPQNLGVGCDLEVVEPKPANFSEDYFAPEERALLKQMAISEQTMIVTLLWSAKECSLKILRQGLRRDTRSVLIDIGFSEQKSGWRTWSGRCIESDRIFSGWWQISDEYIQTVAADQSTAEPQKLQL